MFGIKIAYNHPQVQYRELSICMPLGPHAGPIRCSHSWPELLWRAQTHALCRSFTSKSLSLPFCILFQVFSSGDHHLEMQGANIRGTNFIAPVDKGYSLFGGQFWGAVPMVVRGLLLLEIKYLYYTSCFLPHSLQLFLGSPSKVTTCIQVISSGCFWWP